jgi:hypothetical protein
MSKTHLVKLAVTEHPKYQEEAPERWDWDLIINHREKDFAGMIAAEIVTRLGTWLNEGKQGTDPLIPGLQESLRLLARKAIWKHTQVIVADPAEEATGDGHLRGPQRDTDAVSVPDERACGVRHDRGQLSMPMAGPARARPVGEAPGPRDVSYTLGTQSGR